MGDSKHHLTHLSFRIWVIFSLCTFVLCPNSWQMATPPRSVVIIMSMTDRYELNYQPKEIIPVVLKTIVHKYFEIPLTPSNTNVPSTRDKVPLAWLKSEGFFHTINFGETFSDAMIAQQTNFSLQIPSLVSVIKANAADINRLQNCLILHFGKSNKISLKILHNEDFFEKCVVLYYNPNHSNDEVSLSCAADKGTEKLVSTNHHVLEALQKLLNTCKIITKPVCVRWEPETCLKDLVGETYYEEGIIQEILSFTNTSLLTMKERVGLSTFSAVSLQWVGDDNSLYPTFNAQARIFTCTSLRLTQLCGL